MQEWTEAARLFTILMLGHESETWDGGWVEMYDIWIHYMYHGLLPNNKYTHWMQTDESNVKQKRFCAVRWSNVCIDSENLEQNVEDSLDVTGEDTVANSGPHLEEQSVVISLGIPVCKLLGLLNDQGTGEKAVLVTRGLLTCCAVILVNTL